MRQLLLLALLLSGTVETLAAPRPLLREKVAGLRIALPKHWNSLPSTPEAPEIVVHYYDPSAISFNGIIPSGGTYMGSAHPSLQVVFLEGVELKGTGRDGDPIAASQPYVDWLDRVYGAGRFELMEAQVIGKKNPSIQVDLRGKFPGAGFEVSHLMARLFKTQPGLVIVQYSAPEEMFEKVKDEADKVLGSIQSVKGFEGFGDERLPPKSVDWAHALFLSKFERSRRVQQYTEESYKWMANLLPKGWKATKSKSAYILSSADKKFRKEAVPHLEKTIEWLDQAFPMVVSRDTEFYPLLILCSDSAGLKHLRCTANQAGNGQPVVASGLGRETLRWQMGRISSGVTKAWFLQQDPDFYYALPTWLRDGVNTAMGETFVSKGRVLDFYGFTKVASYPLDLVREAIRQGRALGARELFHDSGGTTTEMQFLLDERAAMLRFLAAPAKGRGDYNEVFPTYIAALAAKVDSLRATVATETQADGKLSKDPFGACKRAWAKHRQEIQQAAMDASFAGWGAREWSAFDAAFIDSVL